MILGMMGLGRIAFQQGDFGTARAWFEQSVSLRRQLGDKNLMAHSLHAVGLVARAQHDFATARQDFTEALTLFREVGNNQSVGLCLAGFAGLAAAQGQLEHAARLFGATEALLERIGAVAAMADRADYERHVALVRSQLAADQFAAAWVEGRAMMMEQAIEYALAVEKF